MKKVKLILCAMLCAMLAFGGASFVKASAPAQAAEQTAPAIEESAQLNATVQDLEVLFVLMQERLNLMHEVAKYKWSNHLNDQPLDFESLDAKLSGNDAQIKSFLEAQNHASELLQKQDFALFQKEGIQGFENVKDYKTEILPQLKSINDKMVETVQDLLVKTQDESLPEFLKELSFNAFKNDGINRDVYDTAIEPLFKN